jgi:hypothetical protein
VDGTKIDRETFVFEEGLPAIVSFLRGATEQQRKELDEKSVIYTTEWIHRREVLVTKQSAPLNTW